MDESHGPTTIPLITEPTRIQRARLYPFPDLTRLWLRVDLSPFTQPPTLEVTVYDAAGAAVAAMLMVEWRDPRISLTLHLRQPPQPGARYTAELRLTDANEQLLDRQEIPFELTFVEPDPVDLTPSARPKREVEPHLPDSEATGGSGDQ